MIGLRLLKSLGSEPGFLRMGVTCPSWRESGTLPDKKEALMILVQKEEMIWLRFCTKAEGSGSVVWEVGIKFAIILKTSSSVISLKSVHLALFFGWRGSVLVLVFLGSLGPLMSSVM